MGYDLHITRAEHLSENKEHLITAEEWLAIIASDDELTLDINNGPYFANWSGSSIYESPWFDWYEGDIYTKHPDQAMLEKMLQIANKLGATVQGDDGEHYKQIEDLPEFSPTNLLEQTKVGWWQKYPPYKRKEFIQNIVMFAIIALVIITVNLLDLW